MPIARRILDALRLVDSLREKPADIRVPVLKNAMNDQEMILAAAADDEKPGIVSAHRILAAELRLLTEKHDNLVNQSRKSITEDLRSQMVTVNSEIESIQTLNKTLEADKKKLEDEKHKLIAEKQKLVMERDKAESQLRESILRNTSVVSLKSTT